MKRPLLAFALLAVACGSSEDPPAANGGAAGAGGGGGGSAAGGAGGAALADGLSYMAPEAQRIGDANAGYHALVNENYVSCGIPWTAYSKVFAAAPAADRITGRDGRNADLPYDYTAITTPTGVEAVTANCLTCHAGRINGELVIGLGNAESDYTTQQVGAISAAKFLLSDAKEIAELDRFVARTKVLEGYTQTRSKGVNPADNLAAILFAHRDPKTFEWKDPPLLEPPPKIVVPVDVPAWWMLKKKHAMFYVGAGRGDHARTVMAASTLCTDDVAEARKIDAYMPDIYAYILSLEAPKYPFPIDTMLAEQGRALYESDCADCHGTYGDGGSFPNLLVDLPHIGTDATLALGASQFADRFVQWFGESFYGEVSRLEPQEGYVAGPLDGIWATAPYFHNGSVPTLEGVLRTSKRPKYWTRVFDSTDYDQATVGWHFTDLAAPTDANAKLVYDTTQLGYGNGGHDFGDSLTDSELLALLEYLKTL